MSAAQSTQTGSGSTTKARLSLSSGANVTNSTSSRPQCAHRGACVMAMWTRVPTAPIPVLIGFSQRPMHLASRPPESPSPPARQGSSKITYCFEGEEPSVKPRASIRAALINGARPARPCVSVSEAEITRLRKGAARANVSVSACLLEVRESRLDPQAWLDLLRQSHRLQRNRVRSRGHCLRIADPTTRSATHPRKTSTETQFSVRCRALQGSRRSKVGCTFEQCRSSSTASRSPSPSIESRKREL